jgi:UDP-glucose 4-epimerase
MAHALVTGCAGFIGSHLTERLLADGHAVTGIDSFEDYYPRAQKEANLSRALDYDSFELVETNLLDLAAGDSADTSRLHELVHRADHIYHLAAQPGVRASWGETFRIYSDNNVLATQMLLEAAKQVGVDAFVYASSSSVYGDTTVFPMQEDAPCAPFSPYGVTKLAAEHLCRLYTRNFGLHTASLRFFTVYGPRQRPDMAFRKFIDAALLGEPIHVFGDGAQTRDFTYVDDIVDGIAAAPGAPAGLVANLAGGSRVSLNEALDVLGQALGAELDVVRDETQPGDVRDTWASIDVARERLDYRPTTTLAEGLAAEVEWCRNRRTLT